MNPIVQVSLALQRAFTYIACLSNKDQSADEVITDLIAAEQALRNLSPAALEAALSRKEVMPTASIHERPTDTRPGQEGELSQGEDYHERHQLMEMAIAAEIAPLQREIAELREQRDQFAEQAALRDDRDKDMQLIMQINNEQKNRAEAAESALAASRERERRLRTALKAITNSIDHTNAIATALEALDGPTD